MRPEDEKRVKENRNREKLKLGQVIDHMSKSARLVILAPGGYVRFRGYVGNFKDRWVSREEEVDIIKQQMETYRKEDGLWDWKRIEALPPQVPFKDIPEYGPGELEHVIYTEVRLKPSFEQMLEYA